MWCTINKKNIHDIADMMHYESQRAWHYTIIHEQHDAIDMMHYDLQSYDALWFTISMLLKMWCTMIQKQHDIACSYDALWITKSMALHYHSGLQIRVCTKKMFSYI